MKRFPLAISYTAADQALSRRITRHFLSVGVGCYDYTVTDAGSVGYELVQRHLEIYVKAHVVLYLIRYCSFEREYPSLELRVGRGRPPGTCLAVLMEELPQTGPPAAVPCVEWLVYEPREERALVEAVEKKVRYVIGRSETRP